MGTVKLGVLEGVAAQLLPRILPAFASRCPGVQVIPTESRTDDDLLERVERGVLDLAICELPLRADTFDQVELVEDQFVLLVPASAPTPRGRRARLSELSDLWLIGAERCCDREHLMKTLREEGVEPQFVIPSALEPAVLALVAAGVGAAIVPRLSVPEAHPGMIVIEHPELRMRTIGLAWARERPRSSAVKAFATAARMACHELQLPVD